MLIVSANYRDRFVKKTAKNRWLLRDHTQPAHEAEVVSSVIATDVVFFESQDREEFGFNCWIVAQAQSAEINKDKINKIRDGEVKLLFRRNHFETENGFEVGSCTSLRLTPDGSVYAILKKEEKKPKKKTKKQKR